METGKPEFIAREILKVDVTDYRQLDQTDLIHWAYPVTATPAPPKDLDQTWATLFGPEDRNVRVNPEWLQVYGIPEVGDYWLVDIKGQVSLCKARTFKLEYEHIAGWRYRHLGKKVWVTTNPDRRTTTWRRMKREMGITHS